MNFLLITAFMVLAVISPGPDFIIVSKNSLTYKKRAGVFTAFGVSLGAFILSVLSVFGLGIILFHFKILFTIIELIGSSYLVYLGICAFISEKKLPETGQPKMYNKKNGFLSDTKAFKDGLLCSTLNPKALLFFTALFTFISEKTDSTIIKLFYGMEVTFLYMLWFSLLVYLIMHYRWQEIISKAQRVVSKILGIFLILIGVHILLSAFHLEL